MSNVSGLTNSLLSSIYARDLTAVATEEKETASMKAAETAGSELTDTVTLSNQSLDLLKTLLESGSTGSATANSSSDQTLTLLQTLLGSGSSSSTTSTDPTLALLQTLFGETGNRSATSSTATGGSGDLMVSVLNEALNKQLLNGNPTLARIFQSSDDSGAVDLVHMSAEDIMGKIKSYQESQGTAADGSATTDVNI